MSRPELEGALSDAGVINCRNETNNSNIKYVDMHLSNTPQWVKYGFLGKMDIALVEAIAIYKKRKYDG
ncbi:hypothetical protein [Romboutsia sp.]|uniref:hypothetical protein n=1 Tax=Romboutsia sp. TaxID=1965302 RepID=UPI002B73782F|nr:hypothetical protein [Romboutsia sp.]HSQ89033.1 hypothetical protein [Romboutsia sp.]